jgi:hypothetical protein
MHCEKLASVITCNYSKTTDLLEKNSFSSWFPKLFQILILTHLTLIKSFSHTPDMYFIYWNTIHIPSEWYRLMRSVYCLHVKFLTQWQIFIKFSLNIMPLEVTPHPLHFLQPQITTWWTYKPLHWSDQWSLMTVAVIMYVIDHLKICNFY